MVPGAWLDVGVVAGLHGVGGRRLAWFVLGWLVVLRFDGGGGCRFRVVGCVGFLVRVGCRWGGFSGWLLAVTRLEGRGAWLLFPVLAGLLGARFRG